MYHVIVSIYVYFDADLETCRIMVQVTFSFSLQHTDTHSCTHIEKHIENQLQYLCRLSVFGYQVIIPNSIFSL